MSHYKFETENEGNNGTQNSNEKLFASLGETDVPDKRKTHLEDKTEIKLSNHEQNQDEKKEGDEESEEDASGMKAMRKEAGDKLLGMEAEFEEGRSRLAAIRARIRRARDMSRESETRKPLKE